MSSWFDCVIHDDKAPLEMFGGGVYFALTIVTMFSGNFVLLNYYGIVGYLVYMVLGVMMAILDGMVSKSLGKNIITLRRNGYTDTFILTTMVFNLFASQALTLVIIHYIGNPQAMQELLSTSTYSFSMVMSVVVNLLSTEVLFYGAHKFLHEHWPSIHVMHHCCLQPSNTTNLIFHPVDLAIEFAGPGGIILFNHFTVWNGNLHVLLVSYMIMQLYYMIDHNEWIRTYHYKHHTQLNAVYTIYANYRSEPQHDKLRKLVVQSNKYR